MLTYNPDLDALKPAKAPRQMVSSWSVEDRIRFLCAERSLLPGFGPNGRVTIFESPLPVQPDWNINPVYDGDILDVLAQLEQEAK